MNRYIFYYLILISVTFATLSALIYLKNNKLLSWQGIGSKKRYLGILYGLTIGTNIIIFFLVFPVIANVGKVSAERLTRYNEFSISVNIPCPGHAYLITNELKTLNGVIESQYSFPNNFKVYYNLSIISIEEILDLEVFKQYPAKITTDERRSK
jgi:copper chaperone CopZ